MNTFLSILVIVITLGSILGCAVLLWWCITDKMGVEEGKSMGHEFDGIEELNNPLPKWWSWMFVATILFAIAYLIAFPGLGNFGGILGWTSANKNIRSLEESKAAVETHQGLVQYDREVRHADEKFAAIFAEYSAMPVEELAYNDEAIKIGQRLFLQNCSQCHGSDARGGVGFPNLTDNDWLYGGSPETIKETLRHGRRSSGMVSWKAALGGEQGVKEVASYVLSLSGRKVNADEAAAGQVKFAICAACHGPDGKGNQSLGAPNLTDNIWLYGGSRMAVEASISNGRAGVMPAWLDILGEDKIHLLTAYVYRLSNPYK